MIVVDDENGDIEGNLIMAASLTSPQHVSFLLKNGSGIVSAGMKEEDLERLELPLMSPETENEDSSAPTFTITVVCFNLKILIPFQSCIYNPTKEKYCVMLLSH